MRKDAGESISGTASRHKSAIERMNVGAHYLGNHTCEFVVWAPFRTALELEIISPEERTVPLQREERGYWKTTLHNIRPGTVYHYRVGPDNRKPDPASHFQPNGVHHPSQVIDHESFIWHDGDWKGIECARMVIYEVHVGTFTPEGTFAAMIPRLDEIKAVGINTIELMPVAQFPGERNWGYDGVYPFAVQNSYGGPAGLKMLVNECHKRELGVILDVVYNHLGPEGNYLEQFGPYFTEKYKTPWGKALNFDGPYNDDVRNFFIQNALHWFHHYHIDALRLDAVHAIFDMSATPFLAELHEQVESYAKEEGRLLSLIAESNLNDSTLIRPRSSGGYGLEAQWLDDFHHCVHTLLTGQNDGYYEDFGRLDQLVKCFREGFVYSGEYSSFRKRRHGNSSTDRAADQFVVFTKNHDQIGNRMLGERISTLVSFEALKLDAAVTLLSPYIPLIFMGEEYAEEAPFLYFVSHSDEGLIESVRKGRRDEFREFQWMGEPPDPQDPATFVKSKLGWEQRKEGHHRVMKEFFTYLLELRKNVPALSHLYKEHLGAVGFDQLRVLTVRRTFRESHVFLIHNFNSTDVQFTHSLPDGMWRKVLDSSDKRWNGPGSVLNERIGIRDTLHLRHHSSTMFIKE